MKNFVLSLVTLGMISSPMVAVADYCHYHGNRYVCHSNGHHDHDGSFLEGVLAILLSLTLIDLTVHSDKQALVIQAVDDAAQFIAFEGQDAPSGLLNSLFNEFRAKNPEKALASDMEIAETLIEEAATQN